MYFLRWGLIVLLAICLLACLSCGDDDENSNSDNDDDTGDDDSGNDDDDTGDDDTFDDDDDTDPTVTTDPDIPLCEEWEANPEALEDPVNIHCLMEKGTFSKSLPTPDTIMVVDWNIERGHHIDDMIEQFQSHPEISRADVILIQEVDRHCSRTDYRNITRELAQALAMDYVYAVEFVELNQDRGEHGNAVLSKYPIVGQRQLRHTDFEKWYEDKDEPRLGGRISILADIDFGDAVLQVASAHFTSGVAHYIKAHNTQAQEVLDLLDQSDDSTIWGGDLNTGLYQVLRFEPSITMILDAGYSDALAHLSHEEAVTHPADIPLLEGRLDWLFTDALTVIDGNVLSEAPLNNLSDHYGIYADFEW